MFDFNPDLRHNLLSAILIIAINNPTQTHSVKYRTLEMEFYRTPCSHYFWAGGKCVESLQFIRKLNNTFSNKTNIKSPPSTSATLSPNPKPIPTVSCVSKVASSGIDVKQCSAEQGRSQRGTVLTENKLKINWYIRKVTISRVTFQKDLFNITIHLPLLLHIFCMKHQSRTLSFDLW